jgi:hypothetical protein
MWEFLCEQVDLVQEQDLHGDKSLMVTQARERRTIDVLTNHRELHIESKSVNASCIRFYGRN